MDIVGQISSTRNSQLSIHFKVSKICSRSISLLNGIYITHIWLLIMEVFSIKTVISFPSVNRNLIWRELNSIITSPYLIVTIDPVNFEKNRPIVNKQISGCLMFLFIKISVGISLVKTLNGTMHKKSWFLSKCLYTKYS